VSAAVGFHMAGVQRRLFRRISRSGDAFENLLPNAALAPTGEPVIDGLVRTVFLWTILPATADFQNMHDPAQDASIVLARRARLVRRQMWNDFRPLLIVEPKQIRIHGLRLPNSVDQAIESDEPCSGLDSRKGPRLPDECLQTQRFSDRRLRSPDGGRIL
jgi:hypothetical protein